jgi:hypothetical protein
MVWCGTGTEATPFRQKELYPFNLAKQSSSSLSGQGDRPRRVAGGEQPGMTQTEERRRGEEMRPPAPELLLQAGLNKSNTDAVHTGECWAAAKSGQCRPVSREQALEALRHEVPACLHCRPDTALGLLE